MTSIRLIYCRKTSSNHNFILSNIQSSHWCPNTKKNTVWFCYSSIRCRINIIHHEPHTIAANPLVKWQSFFLRIIKLRLWTLTHNHICNLRQCFFIPPLRHAVHNFRVFMPRKAQTTLYKAAGLLLLAV